MAHFIVERVREDGVGVPLGFAANRAGIVYAVHHDEARFADMRTAQGFARMARASTTIYKGQTETVRVTRVETDCDGR